MSFEQIVTLVVLVAVIAALIHDKIRADVVALCGAAVLLMTGVVRPIELQAAFASPAIVALAALFVIAYAMELSGLLDAAIRKGVELCKKIGALGIWVMMFACASAGSVLNNTPIVVLSAPVVRDVATALNLSPKRFLMPLSYMVVLFGCTTLLGTSTNLLVNDMAVVAGQPRFGIFEITPVGLIVALAGSAYVFFFSGKLIRISDNETEPQSYADAIGHIHDYDAGTAQLGSPEVFATPRPLVAWKALTSIAIFAAVVLLAAFNVAPIAACAFAGAVLLIILKVISADEAYGGLRPDILILIAGMVVLGIALEESGLAKSATLTLVGALDGLHPLLALIILYGAVLFLTELLSNATVAVLVTPVAVALAEALAVSPRPFLIAVMLAASAAFATPFGYQTNVLVFQMGGYKYMDFVRVGLPLNLLTWAVAVSVIPIFFPF